VTEPDYVRWLRERVDSTPVILPYASAIVVEDGGILLQRRSDFPWWGLPGGVMERGERIETCLVREVREETGLEVEPQRLIGVYSSPDFDVIYPNGDQVHQFTACFACRRVGGELSPDGEEILDLASFSLDSLPEMPPWYRAMVDDYGADRGAISFRRGRPGCATSHDHLLGLRRRFLGSAPILLVGVSGRVWDEAGRLLLVRRTDNGRWSLPAGAVELGERVDTALVREVREETGLEVAPERVVGVFSGPDFFHVYPNGDAVHIVSTLFDCRLVGGRPRPDGRETEAVRFFDPERLPPLPPTFQILVEARPAQGAPRNGPVHR
jgi:8-oxo-dGTP diphosphatase